MPKTAFQDFVFTLIMVISMVFCMSSYNKSLENGLSYHIFIESLKTMWPEAVIAFILQKLVAGPLVKTLLPRLVDTEHAKPLFVSVCMGGLTVFIMAPMMTLAVSLMYNGLVTDLLIIWLENLVINFVFALCIQLFYVGPFVRWLYKRICIFL